jgi:hypothetical protein
MRSNTSLRRKEQPRSGGLAVHWKSRSQGCRRSTHQGRTESGWSKKQASPCGISSYNAEACGLRDFACVVRDYRVPREVAARMGVMPSGSLKRGVARMSVSEMRE